MLILSSDPATEFISWFNFKYSTPPISVKFTYLDGVMCSVGVKSHKAQFDPITWTVWVDVQTPYEKITDVLGHGVSHALYRVRFPEHPHDLITQHNGDWRRVYSEIRDGWKAYIQKTFDGDESPGRRLVR